MEAWLVDWLNLLGRWLHFIAGIAWIGSSFYFIWLDNHLLPPADPSDEERGVGGAESLVVRVGHRAPPAGVPPGSGRAGL